MKNKSIISLVVFLLGFGVSTTSCEDMLTPDMERYVVNFNGKDTVNFYLGILRNLQEVVEQNVILGEVRSDLATTTQYTSDSISGIANFEALLDGDNELLNRAAYYKVINQCNFYLAAVDTMAKKNDLYYMRKEAAQVSVIRAWTYLQLVQNYGRVPFITKPVDNANTGWELNSPEGEADINNLVDLLKKDLELAIRFEDVHGLPNYGSFNTGKSGVDIKHTFMLFPARLVLADIYLTCAKTTADYEKAAQYYYEYLSQRGLKEGIVPYVSGTYRARYNQLTVNGKDSYMANLTNWTNPLGTNSYGSKGTATQLLTVVPSAANASFGKVLTRVPEIYGFRPSSSNTTDSEGATNGQVNIYPDYKYRQVAPSTRYVNLNKSQFYAYNDGTSDMPVIIYPEEVGDARLNGTSPFVETEEGRMRFIQKFGMARSYMNGEEAYSFEFRYTIPVYRLNLVYLRYAEALNRAGHPRFAYTVLRTGLDGNLVPNIVSDTLNAVYEAVVDENGDPVVGIDGKPTYNLVSCDVYARPDSIVNGANYLNYDARMRANEKPYLPKIGDGEWDSWANVGIHSLGCGTPYDADSLGNYCMAVTRRMLDEECRLANGAWEVSTFYEEDGQNLNLQKLKTTNLISAEVRDYLVALYEEDANQTAPKFKGLVEDGKLAGLGDRYDETPMQSEASLQAEINAVESLIADELALELAFEGYRYYDLMRLAHHKINAGDLYSGASWFAWMIARRDLDLAPYESVGDYDANLYGKLLDPNNWYLLSPIYE